MRNNMGNKGGAMRGLDQAAAMSGREMPSYRSSNEKRR